jgi:structural maintenance of chromosome 4
VGPNGSGKSNVIDALLFVFGYRASKIRQGKLSELIHHSENHKDLEACRVSVYFSDILNVNHTYEVIHGSELIVTRTAYRNNKSQYFIDHKISSFTEVTQLLKSKGIDLDNQRFLILQGEVESIAQMKPKAQTPYEDGLLEYLEDIIGTVHYKQPIEESLQTLEELNHVRSELCLRMRHFEKDLNYSLTRKEEAIDYLNVENEIAKLKSLLYQSYSFEIDQNYKKYQQEWVC